MFKNSLLRAFSACCLVLGLAMIGQAAPNKNEVADRVEMVVGSKAFTHREVSEMHTFRKRLLQLDGVTVPSRAMFLEALVNEVVQLDFAKQVKMALTPKDELELESTLLQKYQVGTRAQLEQRLLSEHINTEMFFDYMRNQYLLEKLQFTFVISKLRVEDRDLEKYKSILAEENPEILVEDIVFQHTKMQKQEMQVALKDCRSAREKGDKRFESTCKLKHKIEHLGWRTVGQMPDSFQRPLQGLTSGELSVPIKAENGWHVLRVVDKKPLESLPEGETLKSLVSARKSQDEIKKWVDFLKELEYIEVLALDAN